MTSSMQLRLQTDRRGELSLHADGRLVLDRIHCRISASADSGTLRASPWEITKGTDAGEARCVLYRSSTEGDRPVASSTISANGRTVRMVVDMTEEVRCAVAGDTFEASSVALPAFSRPSDLSSFLVTFGLGPSGNGDIGGYWPAATTLPAGQALPTRAFAPLVLFDDHLALAVAPASQFLTSPLLATDGEVCRGLHGSVERLPEGMRVETVFALGEGVPEALMALGDELLRSGGKSRPRPEDRLLTSTVGWWNAYGGYYTEPIHPLRGPLLAEVIETLRQQNVPVRYLGIDLWYPYRVIGQARSFTPDPAKYPDGHVRSPGGPPLVLHLSALAKENDYGSGGADPSVYRTVAAELKRQGAISAWHDWLRTQQHLTPKLRSDPEAADRWFATMGRSLQREGLDLLLCMQTMGMALASTGTQNAVAARSAIDYLFGQPEALDALESLGHAGFRNDAISLGQLRRQNLLVGFVLYSLGLLPFHDLFLTAHDRELGGSDPKAEAALRALSCGPIAVGDGPGRTDNSIVCSLVSSDGTALQPDHPPFPDTAWLGRPVELYRTECRIDGLSWTYLLALNWSSNRQPFVLVHEEDRTVAWDLLGGHLVEQLEGELAPGELACYMLAPRRGGIAPLGLVDKLVPVSRHAIQGVRAESGWQVSLRPERGTFAFLASSGFAVADQTGRRLPIREDGGLVQVDLDDEVTALFASGGDAE
jgi:hypothetical protein